MRISQGFARQAAFSLHAGQRPKTQHTGQSTERRTHKGSIRYHLDACCELQIRRRAKPRSTESLYTAAQTAQCAARRRSNYERAPRPLFIAATRQHVGKTTVSLAVLSGLRKRFG